MTLFDSSLRNLYDLKVLVACGLITELKNIAYPGFRAMRFGFDVSETLATRR